MKKVSQPLPALLHFALYLDGSELFTDVGEQLVEGVDGCGVVPIPEAGVGGKDDTARIL